MDRLIYTGLSAMRGSMARQTAVANNLANAQTIGFRAELSNVQSLWLDGADDALASRAFASDQVAGADLRPGTVQATGRDLDIALSGDALLGVQAPDGEPAYTRRGDLQVAPSGLLTTGDGHPVLGQQGPITVPPADSITLDQQGRLWIVPAGGDASQPQELDRLRLASPAGSEIAKALDGLFRVRGGGILPDDPDARLLTGSLEGSNVNPTTALVEMMEASKAWDTQLKLISSARDMDSASAGLMQLPN
jgi:flagellar basal-body rod protein FlgF